MKNRVKELREINGLSQLALALKSGVERGRISKIENNKVNVTTLTLAKLANALECSIADLIQDKEKPPNMSGKGGE